MGAIPEAVLEVYLVTGRDRDAIGDDNHGGSPATQWMSRP
jgi:hypothetical protein